jgi:hypothetical protein
MPNNAKALFSRRSTPFTQDCASQDCEVTPVTPAVQDLQRGHSSGVERSLHMGKVRGSKPCARTKSAGVLSLFDERGGPPPKVATRPIPEMGVGDRQLHRTLGVTLKTAWFMSHRIREAMRDGGLAPLGGNGGIVEADETYLWGTERLRAAIRSNSSLA